MDNKKNSDKRWEQFDYSPNLENYQIESRITIPKEFLRRAILKELNKLKKEHKDSIKRIDEKLMKKMVDYGYQLGKKNIERG